MSRKQYSELANIPHDELATHTCPASRAEDMEDDDPVIAEYNVFITPRQLEQIYLLQYPNRNRSQAYNDRNGARPTDFRLKPQAGFMEMDIGMNPSANFNKFQSLVWGEAIRKAKGNGGNGTFGAAAGFAPTKGGKGRGKQEGGEMSVDQGLSRFQEAVNRDAVFQKQTLGGQILQNEAGNPNYMLGAFRGGKFVSLHLLFYSFFLLLKSPSTPSHLIFNFHPRSITKPRKKKSKSSIRYSTAPNQTLQTNFTSHAWTA